MGRELTVPWAPGQSRPRRPSNFFPPLSFKAGEKKKNWLLSRSVPEERERERGERRRWRRRRRRRRAGSRRRCRRRISTTSSPPRRTASSPLTRAPPPAAFRWDSYPALADSLSALGWGWLGAMPGGAAPVLVGLPVAWLVAGRGTVRRTKKKCV